MAGILEASPPATPHQPSSPACALGVASTGMVLASQQSSAYEDVKPASPWHRSHDPPGDRRLVDVCRTRPAPVVAAAARERRCAIPNPGIIAVVGVARAREPLPTARLLRSILGRPTALGRDCPSRACGRPPVAHGHLPPRFLADTGPHGPGRRARSSALTAPRVPWSCRTLTDGTGELRPVRRHDAPVVGVGTHPPARAQCCGEHPGSVLHAAASSRTSAETR